MPPRKASKRRVAANKKAHDLGEEDEAPLSVLTEDMTNIPVRDMTAVVERPLEERRRRSEEEGRVGRPMNSFMLYRSAYTDRIKAMKRVNNHQEVSRLCGRSWKKERPEVKQFYDQLARRERENHLAAHPGYKFAPTKPTASTKAPTEAPNADDKKLPFAVDGRVISHMEDIGIDGTTMPPWIYTPESSPPLSSSHDSMSSPWMMSAFPPPLPQPSGILTPPEPAPLFFQHCHGSPNLEEALLMPRSLATTAVPFPFDSASALAGLPGGAHHDLLQRAVSPRAHFDHGGNYQALSAHEQGQLDPRVLIYSAGARELLNSGLPFLNSEEARGYSLSRTPNNRRSYSADQADMWDLEHETALSHADSGGYLDPEQLGY